MAMDTSANNEARARADWEERSRQHSAAQAHSRSAAILPPPSALTAIRSRSGHAALATSGRCDGLLHSAQRISRWPIRTPQSWRRGRCPCRARAAVR